MKRSIKRALANGIEIEAIRHLIEGETMVWEFDPKQASNAWIDGQYEGTIEKTEEGVSKAGAPMLTITYRVYHPQGREQTVTDYIVRASDKSQGNLFKLKALCEALGPDVLSAFKSGKLDHKKMLRGKNLLLGLVTEESTQYGDRNKVDSYTKLDRAPVAAGGVEVEDPNVPF